MQKADTYKFYKYILYDTIINIVMQVNKKKVSVHLPLAVVQPRQTSNPDVYAVGKSNLGTWCFL